jgi:hypothetical protein
VGVDAHWVLLCADVGVRILVPVCRLGEGGDITNEELMNLMTDMGLHEGGIENWVLDNAWLRVANAVAEKEREECAKICEN